MTAALAQLGDRELAALALAGGQDAYRELLARYKAPVFRLIRAHVGDEGEAMDLVQESFVAGFAALARYDGARPFRVWISRIALNKCRDWARRRKVRAFFARALPLESAYDVAGDGPAIDVAASDRAELARVQRAILDLPANLREVIILRGAEELSQAETSEMLGVSEKTVETRLYRARAKLRAILDA
ncbi:RNA polymerase subunit sigma-24 [Sphingopyxis sp. QXT-31]|uniref:RNA polymerase sigma factor n=1 Tax=Sphingopyxis sp. QXT-31 TaxID=1357916 RepID=UPI0009795D9D|nr:RNA polymerase sigma factor [Sphingopyxis sp. QXT-31]APZ98700.1 RNA polymerase subunit sigma-24 [Sphingopyxis sp. QXT-31]